MKKLWAKLKTLAKSPAFWVGYATMFIFLESPAIFGFCAYFVTGKERWLGVMTAWIAFTAPSLPIPVQPLSIAFGTLVDKLWKKRKNGERTMKIDLITRTSSAYFEPSQFFVADNVPITIKLQDGKSIKDNVHLEINGTIYAFNKHGEIELTTDRLAEANKCELQARKDDGTIVQRWKTETLYRPHVERPTACYETETALLESVKALTKAYGELLEQNAENTEKIKALESGRFTVFKPKGE